jgi:murein DD-endopeptidase MepM/ murein hydrolase activator NlpD
LNGRFWLLLALLIAAAGVGVLAVTRFEGTPPLVSGPERIVLGAAPQTILITMEDEGAGLRSLTARLMHGTGTRPLAEEFFPGTFVGGGAPGTDRGEVVIELDVAAVGLPDGTATLAISVRDWSWRDGFAGGRTELMIPLTVDTRPPSQRPVSGLTYVYRGGSGAVAYRIGGGAISDGVRVGNAFFLGYPHPSGEPDLRIAIFSIPVDAPPLVDARAVAIDEAGNEASLALRVHVLERAFRESDIRIDQAFLERVAVPLAEAANLPSSDPVAAFQAVNSELRARSEIIVREALAASAAEPLFSGAFSQLPGSKVMSRFAEIRSYLFEGEKISEARHFGFDLASTAQAPITAAAAGVVAFAGDLGIYGQCVLVDHGLGVGSLYGHLSAIDVAVGEAVLKGQPLGLSGATGLAGGDHLHFAVLVGNSYVDPLEWWDPKWVRTHVQVRLESSSP